jgi:hypothetical protein
VCSRLRLRTSWNLLSITTLNYVYHSNATRCTFALLTNVKFGKKLLRCLKSVWNRRYYLLPERKIVKPIWRRNHIHLKQLKRL